MRDREDKMSLLELEETLQQGEADVHRLFGDAGVSATASPTHLYAADGTYTVKLITTSDQGCVDSISKTIYINPLPVADFSFTDTCQGVVVQFNDLSSVTSTNIVQWNWSFGGNGTSTNSNPAHAFTSAGTFNVQLRVETDSTCTDSISYQVIAHPNPVAAFTFSNECFSNINDFINTSSVASGSITVYDWDLDDGKTSSAQDTSVFYSAPGVYNVTLNTVTNFGCTNSVTHSLEVYNNPVADFTVANVCQNVPAMFDDNSTSLSGSISNRHWDLDDGTILNLGSGVTFPHNYAAANTYNVEMIATTQYGCDDTLLKPVVIHPMPVVDFAFDTACFNYPTSFFDLSTVSSGAVTTWNWNFNGTPVSGNANPQFTFSQPGLNGVVYTATTDSGCSMTNEHSVMVYYLPEPEFTSTSVCFTDTTFFTNTSSIPDGTIASTFWDFADAGATSNLTSPNRIFTAAGFYDVTLVCTSGTACVDSVTHSVEVYPLPAPAFSAVPSEGCQPLRVDFTDLSTIAPGYNINQWRWDFGVPGAISGTQNTFFLYDTAGTFTVSLTATSSNQCSVTITDPDLITVFPKPNAAFTYQPQPTTIVYPIITFTDLSSVLTGSITDVVYDLGDGNTTNELNPVHTYRDTLTYYVQQIVLTDHGCSDTVTHTIVIDPEFTIYVPTAFTPDDDGLNDIFLVQGIGIKHITLRVYNRWGEAMFFSDALDKGWNGKKFNEGKQLQEGAVYVYFIEITDVNEHTYEFKGTVTLVR